MDISKEQILQIAADSGLVPDSDESLNALVKFGRAMRDFPTSPNLTGDYLIRMLTAYVPHTKETRAAADLVINHFVNQHSLAPKILNSTERHLLHDTMTKNLHDDIAQGNRGLDTLYDYISAGVPGWDQVDEKEFLFEALIRNPVFTTLMAHNQGDTFHEDCLTMLQILSKPAVLQLQSIRDALTEDDDQRTRYDMAASVMYQQLVDTDFAADALVCAQRVKKFISTLPEIELDGERPQ